MNPYPHHPSLAGSPHHHPTGGPGSEPHTYGGGGGGGGSNASGNGTATTPDPSPHSPPYGAGPQDTGPQGYPSHQQQQQQQQQQAMSSNGHHHAAAAAAAAAQAMMQQQQQQQEHHRSYQHPHLAGHMPGYPPVNHNNNNCTLKQEGGPGMATSIQQCAGCGNRIVDRWLLHALERYWHNNCLKCTSCGTALAEIGPSCYSKGNMILCKNDYARLFGSPGACAACNQPIPPTELVTRAGGSVFHTKCFTCTKCGSQLTSGDRYYLLSGSAVCETDFHKMMDFHKKSSSVAAAAATGNGGMPTRKGKVGRPRRSRE